MAKIEFGFSQKDAYDFVIKNERRETIGSDKKVVEKLKAIKYKNPEIDCWGYVERMTAENAPAVLKNVEYFTAPVPFGKYGLGKHYEPYGWTISTALLAFEKGYIDGFISSKGRFFQPAFTTETEGIIVVDPIQRIEVRKYFENEFKEFLEHCKEEDFEYSLIKDFTCQARVGTSKEDTIQSIKDWIEADLDKKGGSSNPREQETINLHGREKFVEACSNLCYYTTDMYNIWGARLANPLTFKSKEDAEAFKSKYNEWQDICREEKKSIYVAPVNESFDKWLRNKIKTNV